VADLAETPTGQSVIHCRRLTADDPAMHRPALARSLNNQSNWLAELGRREEALAAITEAVAIYRELAAAPPARVPYRPRHVADIAGDNAHPSWVTSMPLCPPTGKPQQSTYVALYRSTPSGIDIRCSKR
jgi:hypothetical protein